MSKIPIIGYFCSNAICLKTNRFRTGEIVIALLTVFHQPAVADESATGIVKERIEVMKSIDENMKTLGEMMSGKTEFDVLMVLNSAKEIRAHAEKIPSLFPKGSMDHPTEAKASIWEDWDKFQENALRLREYAKALEISAARPNGDPDIRGSNAEMSQTPSADHLAMMPPRMVFRHISEVCKDCHESFKEKKK